MQTPATPNALTEWAVLSAAGFCLGPPAEGAAHFSPVAVPRAGRRHGPPAPAVRGRGPCAGLALTAHFWPVAAELHSRSASGGQGADLRWALASLAYAASGGLGEELLASHVPRCYVQGDGTRLQHGCRRAPDAAAPAGQWHPDGAAGAWLGLVDERWATQVPRISGRPPSLGSHVLHHSRAGAAGERGPVAALRARREDSTSSTPASQAGPEAAAPPRRSHREPLRQRRSQGFAAPAADADVRCIACIGRPGSGMRP